MNHGLIDDCGSGLAISARRTKRSHAIHAHPEMLVTCLITQDIEARIYWTMVMRRRY
jgi:hypothetical protein